MAGIPLPALDVRAPQQPDLMQNMGNLMALKNAQQQMQLRQQLAPYQLQDAQNQAQLSALNTQKAQADLNDRNAMTKALNQWDGKDYGSLAHLALQNGASGPAVMGIQQQALALRDTASKIAASDAITGSKNAETLKNQLDMAAGSLNSVLQAPDAQMPQTLLNVAQQLAQQKRPDGTPLLDQQHLQMAQSLAQQGPDAIKKALPMFQKSLQAFSVQLDDAQKQASAAAEQAAAAEKNWQMQNGGTQAMADARYRNILMNQKLGKPVSPQDQAFLSAYQKQKQLVPAFSFSLQQQAAAGSAAAAGAAGKPVDWGSVARRYGMTQAAFDQTAEKYFTTGQLPPIGRSPNAIAMNRDLMSRAAELHPNASIAENSAAYKANAASLASLQRNYDQVQAFEQTAEKNMDLLQQTAQRIPDWGTRYANIPVRMVNSRMLGTANMAAFKTALATAQTEAAKVLNSSNASGALSDSSRHELQDIIDGNATLPAMMASLNTLKQDMANRTQAYQMQISDIQGRLKGAGSSQGQQPAQRSAPMTITLPSGKKVTIE